jgi:ribokinase
MVLGEDGLVLANAKKRSVLVMMGRPVIDVTLRVEELPVPGQKIIARSVSTRAGGVDGNYAESLARLGFAVTAVGSDGNGPFAQLDRNCLIEAGVDLRLDEEYAGQETTCFVLVTKEGQRSIIIGYPDDPERVARGVSASLRGVADRKWDLGYLGVLRQFHEGLLDFVRRRVGVIAVTLEASDWPGDWLDERASRIDVVFCADETYASHSADLKKWQEKNGWSLVVTEGARGSWMIDRRGRYWREPASQLEGPVVDTTGAGDAFASAYCAGHLLGLQASSLLRLANWYAGQKVLRAGPRSFPTAEAFMAVASDIEKSGL